MMVEIKPHEGEAMMNLVLVTRALASQLIKNDMTQAVRLQIWAQMLEDVVERMEGKQ